MDKQLPASLAIQFLKKNKAIATLLIGCGVVSNCLVIFLSLSIGTYYETLSHHHSNKSRILHLLHLSFPHKRHYFFILFFTLIVAASFFQLLFRFGSQRIAMDFSFTLRKRLFRQHLRMKTEDFSKKTIGSYLLRYSGDLKNVQSYLEKGFFQFGSDIIFIMIGIVLLFQLHLLASIYVVSGLILGFLLMQYLSSKIKKLENNRTDILSSNLSYIHESLHTFETIKTWNKEFVTIKNFKKKTDRLYDISLRSSYYKSIHHVLPFSILFFTLLTVFLTHIKGSVDQKNSSFIPYILLLLLLFPSIKRIMRISTVWRFGTSGLEKINSILLLPLEEDILQDYEPADGKIEFKNVSFSYGENNKVLDDASFTWQPGAVNYVSGKGKTTMFKLLIGLYEPSGGEIFVDGNEIRHYSKKSLRNHIAFLSEGTGLHGNSIYKSLYLQKRIQSDEEIQDCLKMLRFSTAGQNMEVDLHKNIGQGGRLLSHSDRQKLKIARTLLSKKKILLIDGIIESLDEETQRAVIFFLEQMKNERTIIISGKRNPSIHKNHELAVEWSLSNRFDTDL